MTIEKLEKYTKDWDTHKDIPVLGLLIATEEYLAYRKCVEKWIGEHPFPDVAFLEATELEEALNEITKE